MNFSRKQQHVLLVLYALYGIWLLWFHYTQQNHGVTSMMLESPTPQEQVVYLDHLININSADANELQLLPGIGPVLARRIIAYREQHGKFQSVESLRPIERIGPKTIQRLRHYLTLSE